MIRKMKLYPKAKNDLVSIWFYGLNNFRLRQADDYNAILHQMFIKVTRFNSGHRRHETGQNFISCHAEATSFFIYAILTLLASFVYFITFKIIGSD